MRVSENSLKWAMRLYPPLLFQRIWVKKFEKGFSGVSVKIFKSILNINYNRSIFGGTIFNAADPFYPVLLYQILNRKGYKTKIWVKRSEIEYLKPAFNSLYFKITITEADVNEICSLLNNARGVVKTFNTEVVNAQGELYCLVKNDIYIRYLKE